MEIAHVRVQQSIFNILVTVDHETNKLKYTCISFSWNEEMPWYKGFYKAPV